MNIKKDRALDLNLQSWQSSLVISSVEGKKMIYDPLRKKNLVLQPEEWVRQLIIAFLHKGCHFPLSRMVIERALPINGKNKRFDLIIFDKKAQPWMLVECKSFDVKLNEKTALQAAEYNAELRCPYLMISNGVETYVCEVNWTQNTTAFLDSIPSAR